MLPCYPACQKRFTFIMVCIRALAGKWLFIKASLHFPWYEPVPMLYTSVARTCQDLSRENPGKRLRNSCCVQGLAKIFFLSGQVIYLRLLRRVSLYEVMSSRMLVQGMLSTDPQASIDDSTRASMSRIAFADAPAASRMRCSPSRPPNCIFTSTPWGTCSRSSSSSNAGRAASFSR